MPAIYVVDNGSSDATMEILRSFSELTVIDNKENLGFGGGNNLALKQAYRDGHDHFFLVNQDTYLFEDTISTLVSAMDNFREKAIFSPLHLNGQADHMDDSFRLRFLKNQELFPDHPRLLDDFKNDRLEGHYEVKFANAAFWMLSRKTLEEVGLFHPFFFHYGEDVNYWDRARMQGYKMIVIGEARACHDRIRTPIQKRSARPYFEKELLIYLLNENGDRPRGRVWVIISDGLGILFKNAKFWEIPGFLIFCLFKGLSLRKKVKSIHPYLGIK